MHHRLSIIQSMVQVQLEVAKRRAESGLLGKEELVVQVKENMAVQAEANRWLQKVTVAGLVGVVGGRRKAPIIQPSS